MLSKSFIDGKYLRATTGFNSIITKEDKVCPTNYIKYTPITNVHKILSAINEERYESEGQISLDAGLNRVIINLKRKPHGKSPYPP